MSGFEVNTVFVLFLNVSTFKKKNHVKYSFGIIMAKQVVQKFEMKPQRPENA